MSRRGPRERPGLLNNFGMAKHCFKSALTASTSRRRSGPGRTYLAQIDVSLRAVGRETLTRLGNSRATAAVTLLLLLLLCSPPPARTKVPSPNLSPVGRSSSRANSLLSPRWVSARVCLHSPVPHAPYPLPLEHGWGHNVPYFCVAVRVSQGIPPDSVRTRTQAASSLCTLSLPWY